MTCLSLPRFCRDCSSGYRANNVVTLTRYLGSDPEGTALSAVLGQGIDAGSLPQSRNFMVGIKINL